MNNQVFKMKFFCIGEMYSCLQSWVFVCNVETFKLVHVISFQNGSCGVIISILQITLLRKIFTKYFQCAAGRTAASIFVKMFVNGGEMVMIMQNNSLFFLKTNSMKFSFYIYIYKPVLSAFKLSTSISQLKKYFLSFFSEIYNKRL